jgi:molybdenum-dependent DNA-binding transcriptional regulator ModE
MDLNAIRMLVSVVQAGSLSAGAARLGLPLPTVSRRIRDLERQLSVQLLERSVRGTRAVSSSFPRFDGRRFAAPETARVRPSIALSSLLALTNPP